MNDHVTPDSIMQLGLGFWNSKALLTAVELGLFTELAKGPLDAETLTERLGIHSRAARDFFDSLVATFRIFKKRRTFSHSSFPSNRIWR